MIKIERVSVMNWENAIRGARNPMNSWDKSDSGWTKDIENEEHEPAEMKGEYGFFLGHDDLSLMMRLRNAGTDHRKFMRQIFVSVDITAPLYWWKEADTYTVGKVQNSCSTMHKIHAKEFTLDDFSHEHLWGDSEYRDVDEPIGILNIVIDMLNQQREYYLQTKDKEDWWQMIQLLPSSYNQLRTVTLNYEVLANMYHARRNHKLDEWVDLCKWIETLPYSQLITGET